MADPNIVFQRTHAGRTEIHEKKYGLTQSERLVLIMIDGVTPYHAVRAKLPVLKAQRFERAIHTLQQKELICEVFLPVDGEKPEEVERSVIDRYLQQDPSDPVTIILSPEDERLDLPPETPKILIPAQDDQSTSRQEKPTPPVLDEHDMRTAEEIGEQARARQRTRPKVEAVRIRKTDEIKPGQSRRMPGQGAPLIYWAMAVSGAFLLGYALARLSG